MARRLAIFVFMMISMPLSAQAEENRFLRTFKNFLLDEPLSLPHALPARPSQTNHEAITTKTKLQNVTETTQDLTGCLSTHPYASRPLMDDISHTARIMMNNAANTIDSLSIQPHFSGLKGPKIILIRKDLERALVHHQGSSQEIHHNTQFQKTSHAPCDRSLRNDWDIELKHHIDLDDSDKAPLIRSDVIWNERLHFGGYFLGTTSLRYRLYDNLDRDNDLRILTRNDPVRQDVIGFAWQGTNLERLMVSGFATPKPDLYIGGHLGFIEESFFGLGGEMLYRPFGKNYALGGEIWRVAKRYPYNGGLTTLDDNQKHTSALLNLWYDLPSTPYTFGVSAGRFLDGDKGVEGKIRYTPATGWRIEGFTTLSNEDDETLRNKDTNIFAGLRLTMPLGRLSFLPENSRQTVELMPFARDKGQKIDNPYPLYDLTDPWQAKNLHKYWNTITE